MIDSFRRRYGQLATSGVQAMLLLAGFQSGEPVVCAVALSLCAAISLWAWMSSTRRQRAIDDMPTSRVASAAQGYVELRGRGRPLGGLPLRSPLTGLPCLWYRYRVECRREGEWVYEGSGESDASFILDDGSAQCLIDLEGAELRVTRCDHWVKDERRCTQWLLIENDPIYVLGQFVTQGSVDLKLDVAADVKALLADWKKDRPSLLARFDIDHDGELDLDEWERARQQARREVVAQHRELRAQPEVSIVRRPRDGRLFLVSDVDPARLARRFRLWAWLHLGLFLAALAGSAYVWRGI